MAAQQSCYNLDSFLMSSEDICRSFTERSLLGDVGVVEGNRGLYDGVDVQGSCSTAELAKLLGAPVVLVLDVTKTTRTAAALVLGCQQLDPGVKIAGDHQDVGLRVLGMLEREACECYALINKEYVDTVGN